MVTSDIYRRLPLPPSRKYIRLLTISTDNTNDADQIVGNLSVVDLSEDPKYTAISYVWGNFAYQPDTLQCGSESIKITANCRDVLRQLRKRGQTCVWIDAICINQEDDAEKSIQIRLMRDIYAAAGLMVIWFGKSTDTTNVHLDYLKTAGFQSYLRENDQGYQVVPDNVTPWRVAFETLLNTLVTVFTVRQLVSSERLCLFREMFRIFPGRKINLHEVEKLLLCPWATRIWTLQEVLLAEKPTIWIGDQTLEWRSLMYSVSFFDHVRQKLHCNNLDAICTTWSLIFEVWLSTCETPSPQSTMNSTRERRLLGVSRDRYLQFIEQVLAYYELFSHMLLGPSVVSVLIMFFVGFFICQKEETGLRPENHAQYSCQTSTLGEGTAAILIFIIMLFLYLFATTVMGTNTADMRVHLGMFLGLRQRDSYGEPATSDVVQNYLIRQVRARKATNPRDKLFGLQCILERLAYPLHLPNYTDSQAQVFKSLFLTLLRKTQYWDLLLCCKYQSFDGPSWVPNWSIDLERHWLHNDHVFKSVDAISLEQQQSHGRPHGHDCSPRILPNLNQISVHGFMLGKVKKYSPPLVRTRREFRDEDDRGHQHNIGVILNFLKDLMTSKDRRSLSTTCTHSVSPSANRPPTPDPNARSSNPDTEKEHPVDKYQIPHPLFTKKSDYRHPSYRANSPFYQTYRRWLAALYNIKDIPQPAKQLSLLRSKLGKRLEYHVEICDDLAMCNRRFFTTDTEVFGNAPEEVQVGDEVVWVRGVSRSLVLRGSLFDGGGWRLVGFANVDGEGCKDGNWDCGNDGGGELPDLVEYIIE